MYAPTQTAYKVLPLKLFSLTFSLYSILKYWHIAFTVASTTSKNFAKVLNNEIVKTMKELDPATKDRGVKSENFTVIYKASMPSVLCEYGFYSNLDDLKILKNNQAELVEATVKSICQYFGIEYKEKVKATENKFIYRCKMYSTLLIYHILLILSRY